MSEPDGVGSLAVAPLFEGLPRSELVDLARIMSRRPVSAGDVLWHQGTEAQGMALIVEGRVSVTLRLPGDRTFELVDAGPGETLGDLPLIDGGAHSATARVTQDGSVLFLSRAEFAALVSRHHPSAFTLKRQFAAVTAARLRRQLEYLADTLGPRDAVGTATQRAQLEFTSAADSAYIRRMARFRAVDARALSGLMSAGRFARAARGWTLEVEGEPASALYMVINGAVEKVLIRGDRRIRVGLAGPGRAFGYEGLIDGAPSPAHAIARERALLLVLPQEDFVRLFRGEGAESLTFLDVVNRDIATWLRQAIRPQARLAVRPTS